MINREWQEATVLEYSPGIDARGQRRKTPSAERIIEIVPKIYSQTNVSDPRYVDVEIIGLTKDKDITTENRIQIGGNLYDVLYLIPSGRLTQVLMRLNHEG